MIRLVLLDFNGTILDDWNVWDAARCENFRSLGVEPPLLTEYLEAVTRARGDYIAAYAEFGVDVTNREKLNGTYERGYLERIGEIRLVDGTLELLEGIRERGILCGIVTAQMPTTFWKALRRFPEVLDRIDALRCGVSDKAAAIRNLASRMGVATSACAYVGDMPSDAVHARNAKAFAVRFRNTIVPDALFNGIETDATITDLREVLAIVDHENANLDNAKNV